MRFSNIISGLAVSVTFLSLTPTLAFNHFKTYKESNDARKPLSKSTTKGVRGNRPGQTRRTSSNVEAVKTATRSLKSGKGGKGSLYQCGYLTLLFYIDDFQFEDTDWGSRESTNVYDAESHELVGLLKCTYFSVPETDKFPEDDSVGSCIFSFDMNDEDLFESQISISTSDQGYSNLVTGGTGRYACASGQEELDFSDDKILITKLTICNTCADESWYTH